MKKALRIKAWVGLCDGKLSWSTTDPPDPMQPALEPSNLCELFRTRKAAEAMYEDVRRVTLIIERGR